MSDNTTQPVSKEFIDGVMQGLRACEIYLENGGTINLADIKHERAHYKSLPVKEPSRRDLSKIEVSEKSAEVKELNSQLSSAASAAKELMEGLNNLREFFRVDPIGY